MTKTKLAQYRKALAALAANLKRALRHDRHEVLQMDEPDLPDGPMAWTGEGLDSGTQEVETGIIANEELLLAEVVAALARIEAGTYGRCVSCGRTISTTRLDAIPYARQCIRCAKVSEAAR